MRKYILKGILLKLAIVLPALGLAGATWANDEALTYNRIHLSTSASTQIENDTLIAILYVQREGTKLPELANEVNKRIGEAIRQSKQVSGIDLQTLAYQSNPIYDKQRLSGWRVRQSIRLESQDTASLSQLIGDLQRLLAVESINYQVSPGKMREVEETLIAEAIDAFTQRAKLITNQLNYKHYRLVDITINTMGQPIHGMHTRGLAMQAEMASPVIEAGKQDVQITVSGTIEMHGE